MDIVNRKKIISSVGLTPLTPHHRSSLTPLAPLHHRSSLPPLPPLPPLTPLTPYHKSQINDKKKDGIKFWLENPISLFQDLDILPNPTMTNDEKLNALTRAIIIISAIMFAFRFPTWWLFLFVGILVVIVIWYMTKDINRDLKKSKPLKQTNHSKRRIITPLTSTNKINQII